MSSKTTGLSAQHVLKHCHRLDRPALLYSGASGHSLTDNSSPVRRFATLACRPTRHLIARNSDELHQLLSELRTAHGSANNINPSPESGFHSGWVGYLSYDAGRSLVGLNDHAQPNAPLAEFFYYPQSLALDLNTDTVTLQGKATIGETEDLGEDVHNTLESLKATLETNQVTAPHQVNSQNDDSKPAKEQPLAWQAAWDQQEYTQAFHRVRDYLLSGDTYQVNLAMPFHCQQNLRNANPLDLLSRFDAPFAAYFRTDSLTLFSVSPERFIHIGHEHITASPIKGTIPRGETEEEDNANRLSLKHSEKDQAENLMIVDLLRNDIGRSAQPGSVKVTQLFDIESHANVHHMVSTIEARQSPELDALDVIINAFPGGSITGAPKRRAMEIIDELEPESRGLYCGSFGYLDDSGTLDFNILIRSIVANEQQATCWGGGALVMDSTAESEYNEVMAKVGRILATPLSNGEEAS